MQGIERENDTQAKGEGEGKGIEGRNSIFMAQGMGG